MTIEDIIRNIIREELSSYKTVPQPEASTPVTAPPVAAPPVPPGPPTVSGPITAPAPPPPVAAPPVAAPPATGPSPVTAPQVASPMTGVPTLDEIRVLANDFARARPDKAGEFFAFMQGKGVQSLADMPPAEYPACKAELQRLMGA